MSSVVVGDVYTLVAELLRETQARPSELRIHRVAETVNPADPGPIDPRRADLAATTRRATR